MISMLERDPANKLIELLYTQSPGSTGRRHVPVTVQPASLSGRGQGPGHRDLLGRSALGVRRPVHSTITEAPSQHELMTQS
jgi:hypothetical protein